MTPIFFKTTIKFTSKKIVKLPENNWAFLTLQILLSKWIQLLRNNHKS